MKQFLLQMEPPNNAVSIIVDDFMRSKSLLKLRSTFRGCMGLPRTRPTDKQRRNSGMSMSCDNSVQSLPSVRKKKERATNIPGETGHIDAAADVRRLSIPASGETTGQQLNN